MPKETKPNQATIEDKNLIESTLYLKQNTLLLKSKSIRKFETTYEAEEEKKEEIIYIIKEKTSEIKADITELQKTGYNLHLEIIKLIGVPLKTKVWLATLSKKDLENIFKIFESVKKIITPLKKENEEKIAEKERLEKETDQKTIT